MKFSKSAPDFIPDQTLVQKPVIGLEKRGCIPINERSGGACAFIHRGEQNFTEEEVTQRHSPYLTDGVLK